MIDPDLERNTAAGAPPTVAADVGAGAASDLPPALPEPVLARQNRLRLSLVWVVPLVAVVIGAVLVVRTFLQTGPEIGIVFRSAQGIEPGRTEVRFKEVVVGRVKSVKVQPDRQAVRVTVSLDKSVASLAVADSRFWVVSPRIGTGGVSGLSTLLSGAYIAVDAGESGQARQEFVGLDNPPLILRGEPGRSFVLRADDLGSLDVGSPVYHRHIRVGRVVGYSLEPGGKFLQVQVFIEAPNESLVTQTSHFWNVGGIDFTLSTSGLKLNTESLASLLAGGLAFASPPGSETGTPAPAGQQFLLYANQGAALSPDEGEPVPVRMVFHESLRGLDEGAPIDLLGTELGTVRRMALHNDGRADRVSIEVRADLFPSRLAALRQRLPGASKVDPQDERQLLKQLVERGLRAQVRTGNLLTGKLYVALDFVPNAAAVAFDAAAAVPTLPTMPGTLADVQPQLAAIVSRLANVRFDEIGSDLQVTLKTLNSSGASLQSTLASADAMIRQLTPEAQRALDDVRQTLASAQQALSSAERNLVDPQAPLQRNAAQTLLELQRAAQALRVLVDYLQRHPESMLRGKAADAPLTPTAEPAR